VKLPEATSLLLRVPRVTLMRSVLALAVAVAADGLQFLLGPFGWAFVDQVIDVIAMGLTAGLLGFHVLLLPTFVLELVPLVQDLPSWTACVAAVIVWRKRQQRPPKLPERPAIDI
jgi:hypothetical protein